MRGMRAPVPHSDRSGRRLEAGQRVFLSIVAANHDEQVFREPARLDLTRDPNPHLAFGWGLHHCIGAHLANLEARVALRTFIDRYPRIEPAGDVPAAHVAMVGSGRGPITLRLGL